MYSAFSVLMYMFLIFTDFVITGNWENSTHCDYLDNVYPPTCGYIDINISTPFQKPGGQNCKGVIDFWRRQVSDNEKMTFPSWSICY